jgi:hypothetical protein
MFMFRKQTRKKMDPKATKGILIGYDHDDGYRIFDKEECKLIRSRDVVFEEKTLEHTKSVIIPEDDSTSKQEIQADRDDELTDDDEEGAGNRRYVNFWNFRVRLRAQRRQDHTMSTEQIDSESARETARLRDASCNVT